MNFEEINIEQTHIRLTTDVGKHNLKKYIYSIRNDLKNHIMKNRDFQLSLEPLNVNPDEFTGIIHRMYETSICCDVGPMACVAGTISEMSLDYLINLDSKYSIVENGGDIAVVNDTTVLCGIYSNNNVLGNNIAFEVKSRSKPLGICTSSGKIGHSISFGASDSVTVISKRPSFSDALATRIANDVNGNDSEEKVVNGLETAENYNEFFDGVLIISEDNVGTIGKLPKIVESKEFKVKI